MAKHEANQNLIAWYDGEVAALTLDFDPAQKIIVEIFQGLIDRLQGGAVGGARVVEDVSEKTAFNWFGLFKEAPSPKVAKGLYIFGGVGRGKTMIMDKAFSMLKEPQKNRYHFNDFMLDVHARLKTLRQKAQDSDAKVAFLQEVAAKIASESQILAFDEFQVRDIADAMIMKGLFEALFREGVVVIATSNVAPDDLYGGGLQRARFLPFIPVLKKYVDVVHVDSETDYRLQKSGEGIVSNDEDELTDLYLTPMGSKSYKRLEAQFLRICEGGGGEAYRLELQGRAWDIKRASRNGRACMVGFAECCEQPRAAEDYIALAESFPIVILSDVPKMGYDRRNEAKRFILLLDTLYDKGCALVVSAEAEPELLYYGSHHEFEFQRTISRLQEMRRFDLAKF